MSVNLCYTFTLGRFIRVIIRLIRGFFFSFSLIILGGVALYSRYPQNSLECGSMQPADSNAATQAVMKKLVVLLRYDIDIRKHANLCAIGYGSRSYVQM